MEIDLHVHTNKSDGKYTPKEVIDLAKKNNVRVLSICDHDTTDAYTKSLMDYSKKNDIKLINGVEISTKYKGIGFHVLGYNMDIHNKEFKEILSKIRNSRHDYLYNVSKKLTEYGYVINTDKLDKISSVTKAHIALDIIENKLNEDKLLKDFKHIPSKGEFIETIMNEECPCYVQKVSVTPLEAAEIIRKYGGKVVLAHPVAYFYENNLSVDDIRDLIIKMNADGLEGNYIYIDKDNNCHNDIDLWNNLASKLNIMSTLGSDFHDLDDIHPNIGLTNYNIKFNTNFDEIIAK